MKHAYLIMAHDQFVTLKELVSILDDARNDIYIHFDKKVKRLPELRTQYSKLTVLEKRVSVIWGDVSQIEAEYALYKASFKEGEYSYYHLISGTHFPLKSNDDLHKWFDGCNGACVMRKVALEDSEIKMRFGQYHFFLKHLVSKKKIVNKAYHFGWRMMLKIQKHLGIQRDTSFIKGKASQWCSLNEDAVRLLLKNEIVAMKRFRKTFCCDEFFVRSIIEDSGIPVVYDNRICYVEFHRTTPKKFSDTDFDKLISSDALFFRKLIDSNISLGIMIERYIKKMEYED